MSLFDLFRAWCGISITIKSSSKIAVSQVLARFKNIGQGRFFDVLAQVNSVESG
jgi:hypothetical protein